MKTRKPSLIQDIFEELDVSEMQGTSFGLLPLTVLFLPLVVFKGRWDQLGLARIFPSNATSSPASVSPMPLQNMGHTNLFLDIHNGEKRYRLEDKLAIS